MLARNLAWKSAWRRRMSWLRMLATPNHCHWRIQLGSCWKLHLPWVHNLELTLHWCRGQQQNCQGNGSYGKLNQRVWNNSSLTEKTRIHVYQACVLSTLLYGSESWTTYARHEKKLNSFHQRWLRRILHIKWQDKISNTEVLERANMMSMYTILCKRRLRRLGHVKRIDPGRMPKDLLYGKLAEGSQHAGHPQTALQGCLQERHEAMQHW